MFATIIVERCKDMECSLLTQSNKLLCLGCKVNIVSIRVNVEHLLCMIICAHPHRLAVHSELW